MMCGSGVPEEKISIDFLDLLGAEIDSPLLSSSLICPVASRKEKPFKISSLLGEISKGLL